MKKSILCVFVIALLALGLAAQNKEEQAEFQKIRELFFKGKLAEALTAIDNGIKKYGESDLWLEGRFRVLMGLKKYEQAYQTALKKDKISKEKEPHNAVAVAMVAVNLKKNDEALNWLEEAVKRGFSSYGHLESKTFASLKDNKRFQAIIQKVKENLGIGKKAKDFTVALLSGEKFTLSRQTGKVVLVDFWAVWCSPCIKEMPNVKKTYAAYKDKGLEIIGISLDKDLDKLNEYLNKEDIQWKISCSGKEWKDETRKLYKVDGIPSTWLVDRKGVLRYSDLRGEELDKAIAKLIAEK